MLVAEILSSYNSQIRRRHFTRDNEKLVSITGWTVFYCLSICQTPAFHYCVSLPQQSQHVCEAAEQVFGSTTGKPPLWSAEAFGWDQRHQAAGGAGAQEHHEIPLLFHHNTATKAAVWRRKCKLSYLPPHLRHPLRLCDMSLLHSWDASIASMSSKGNTDLHVFVDVCWCGCS